MNYPNNTKTDSPAEVDASKLRSYVERAERLHEERDALGKDLSDVYAEAKGNGFDVATIKKVVSIRRMDRDKRIEAETILDIYLAALGMS